MPSIALIALLKGYPAVGSTFFYCETLQTDLSTWTSVLDQDHPSLHPATHSSACTQCSDLAASRHRVSLGWSHGSFLGPVQATEHMLGQEGVWPSQESLPFLVSQACSPCSKNLFNSRQASPGIESNWSQIGNGKRFRHFLGGLKWQLYKSSFSHSL